MASSDLAGKMSMFNNKYDALAGNWVNFIDRLKMMFRAHKITSDEVKLAILIAGMGQETYNLLTILVSPSKPSSYSYEEVVKVLQDYLQPKPAAMAERYRFRQRKQLDGESIAEYLAELKQLSKFCLFEPNQELEHNIRDQFICGLQSEPTRERLFLEKNLNLSSAVTLATDIEATESGASHFT